MKTSNLEMDRRIGQFRAACRKAGPPAGTQGARAVPGKKERQMTDRKTLTT